MLVARSPQECFLYMDLHPCECGEIEFDRAFSEEVRDGVTLDVYQGMCANCGLPRRFEFLLPEPDAVEEPAFGGDEPSQIIDPGEFFWTAEQAAATVPADPADLPREEWPDAQEAMEIAVAAMAEVLKFLPDGAEEIPGSAFTSELGRALYAEEPERFRRNLLQVRLRSYQEGLADYAA